MAKATREVIKNLTPARVNANVVAIRDKPKQETVFGLRTGLFGHPTTTVLRVPDDAVVGAVENVQELGDIVTRLGLLTLGALLGYNLAGGPEGLARRFAEWAGIDLTVLANDAAASDAADLATAAAEVERQKALAAYLAENPDDEASPAGEPPSAALDNLTETVPQ